MIYAHGLGKHCLVSVLWHKFGFHQLYLASHFAKHILFDVAHIFDDFCFFDRIIVGKDGAV
jgi:hypothetical protein